MADRDWFYAPLYPTTGSGIFKMDHPTSQVALFMSRTISDLIQTSFRVIGGHFTAKMNDFIESRKSRCTLIQFFAFCAKTKGLGAQRCYTSTNKHAYCGSFEPKDESLRPSEAEISIAHNRDKAHYPMRALRILHTAWKFCNQIF